MTYSNDIDLYYFINYLLDNGLNLNNTFPYSSQENINFPNITIFNKVIYRMCSDLDNMYYGFKRLYQIEMKRYTKILKIFFMLILKTA